MTWIRDKNHVKRTPSRDELLINMDEADEEYCENVVV